MQKILLIEDEPNIARFVELELSHEGYEVHKAADGREGLKLAEEGKFDLVLLDIMLPGLNGLEVLRRLRRESQVPVIMLTARDAVMDKVTGLDMGADDYITKPFSIEELLARIRSALRKQQRQETR
ncbi:MAG TPA: response regulator, partial [Clostridia bacterium]|nr:response regulator [Clostridia bacterium]